MKTKLKGRDSLLCLCLLIGVCGLSCAVKHDIKKADSPAGSEEKKGAWEIRVVLLPGFTVVDMPQPALSAMNITYEDTPFFNRDKNCNGIVTVIYRVYNHEQYRQLLEQLTQCRMTGILGIITVSGNNE